MAKTPTAAGAREPNTNETPVEGSGATPNAKPEAPITTEAFTPPDALNPDKVGSTPPGLDLSNVETIKVKTTGDFMLQDPYTLKIVDHDSEGEDMPKTSFIETALADGRLEKA